MDQGVNKYDPPWMNNRREFVVLLFGGNPKGYQRAFMTKTMAVLVFAWNAEEEMSRHYLFDISVSAGI